MKSINITTAQNVSIEYKVATVFERMLAWLIDILILSFILLILIFFISVALPQWMQETAYYIILIPVAFFYHLAFEIFNNGASPGKRIFNLKVVKINSRPVSIYNYFMRWAFRLIDILSSFGILAFITISSSFRNQRIGDFLADTTVIKVMKSDRISLHRIIQLDELKNYTPVYPEVIKFSESDMLVLNEVLGRYNKYPGEESKLILEKAFNKIESVLNIKLNDRNANTIKILIKDYVASTR